MVSNPRKNTHPAVGAGKLAGGRLLALLLVCFALFVGPPAASHQTANSGLSPMRALQQSRWVAEGSAHPRHVLYAFVDANCPYCHELWRALTPYYREGLQVRDVLVGVIAPSSPGKAAAIFGARDPAAAWNQNEERWGSRSDGGGGIAPLAHISAADKAAILDNELLMQKFGISGTPGMVYVGARGAVHVVVGAPGPSMLKKIIYSAAVPKG